MVLSCPANLAIHAPTLSAWVWPQNDDLRLALNASISKVWCFKHAWFSCSLLYSGCPAVQLMVAVDLLESSEIPSPYYTVEFGTAAIGMILTITDKLEVKVVDMRSDSSGRPLAALASGKIAIGDVVLAVNGVPLMNHRTLESVAEEFRRAKRPARVLFERAAPQSE